MKILYVDVETTGLDRGKHSIWQIAGIINDGKQQEEFNIKMAPYGDEPVTEQALTICGITREELYNYQPAKEAYKQFHDLLTKYVDPFNKTDKFYFCGYNANFDSDFIRRFFEYHGDTFFGSFFWFPVLDVMQLVAWANVGKRQLLPNFQLSTVYNFIMGEPMKNAHDAFADIQATKEILNTLIKKYGLFNKG